MKNIHMIGVGGVGMAALAVLLKRRGEEVSGCDLGETPRTRWLREKGVDVVFGHNPAHVRDVDEVIVTPAVRCDNPERCAARRIRTRGEVLAALVSAEPDSIAVCGSHGKTTTSTWIARLLIALGENVEWAIGGETGDFPVAGYACGNAAKKGTSVLVVEADESDGTLAAYHAKTLVVTNCEYDHPDHFPTYADYLACYEIAKRQAGDVILSESLSPPPDFACLAALAPHNQRNAATAIEVARRRGHALEAIGRVLPSIVTALPDRRFQKLEDGVYTDYAHHPTEMANAIAMARRICRGCLRVIFQPHRYSRTKALMTDFPAAFAQADEVVLCPTYAAFEKPVEGGDVADLYAICRAAALPVKLARSCEEAWTHAETLRRPEDVTLLLGAGDLLSRRVKIPPRRHWIGCGANTWKSDLATGETYVPTQGPASRPGVTLGIPWMAGIPGSIGGWIRMNAGAFGHSISDVLEAVKVDGVWKDAASCGFGYRTSAITGEIQDCRLRADWVATGTAADYLARRRKFPTGTWGSVFKNPPGDFAGRLLESVGAKGMRVGGAFVWEEHANVIVRGDGATPSDVLALVQILWRRVLIRTGVSLEPEICGLIVGKEKQT